MARAGFCSTCGANVWLREDGSCASGHPQSSISNEYDVVPPGSQAPAGAINGTGNPVAWLTLRAWLVGIGYWLVSTGGAGALERAGGGESTGNGWIVLVMLVIVGACMASERGEWSVGKRVGYVLAAWLLHAILSAVLLLPIAAVASGASSASAIVRLSSFLATLPFVIYAMWHSRWFVKSALEHQQALVNALGGDESLVNDLFRGESASIPSLPVDWSDSATGAEATSRNQAEGSDRAATGPDTSADLADSRFATSGAASVRQTPSRIRRAGWEWANRRQKVVLVTAVIVIALMGLVPPWSHAFDNQSRHIEIPGGYSFIAAPPSQLHPMYSVRVDATRLVIQWLVVVAFAGLGLVLLRDPSGSHRS